MARYNNLIHSSTGHSPFYTLHGYHPYDGYNPRRTVTIPAAEEFASTRDLILEEVKSALADAKTRMKEQYDKHKSDAIPYSVGDRVWLESKNYPSDRPSHKLDDKRYGPFKILKKIGRSAYKLQIPSDWKKRNVHDVFNESILTPYVAPFFPNQVVPEPPPPVLADHDAYGNTFEDFEIESILDSRWYRKKLQYKIHWKGFPSSDDEWKLATDIDAGELIEQFHQKYHHKPPNDTKKARRG